MYYYIDRKHITVTLKTTSPCPKNPSADISLLGRMASFVIIEDTDNNTFELIKNRYGYSTYRPNSLEVFKKYSEFCNNILNEKYVDVSVIAQREEEEFLNRLILQL